MNFYNFFSYDHGTIEISSFYRKIIAIEKTFKFVSADNDEKEHWLEKKSLPKNVAPFPFPKTFEQELEEIEENIEETSAPNGVPFFWEQYLDEKKCGYKGNYYGFLDEIDRSP